MSIAKDFSDSFRFATRAFLCVQHLGLQHFTRTVSPPFLQQMLLSTVVNALSPVALFAWSGPVVYLQDFPVKAGLRRRLRHSFPYNHHGCMTHRPIGVTRGLKFTPLHANGCQTCDVSSKWLEHPPLASVHALLTDGSRAPPSA